jgi:hypothetical protein
MVPKNRAKRHVVQARSQSYQYLALCVYQLTKAERESSVRLYFLIIQAYLEYKTRISKFFGFDPKLGKVYFSGFSAV